jgi:hypothetical protein
MKIMLAGRREELAYFQRDLISKMDMTYLKYPVYFLSGSLLITAITLIAEKKSQKVAGILMCLPVITFLSLLFLGISQGTDFASRAAVWNPIGAIADLVYLGFFAIGINIPGYTAAARNESIRRKKIVELLCGLFFGFTGYFISILIFSGFTINSGWISLPSLRRSPLYLSCFI